MQTAAGARLALLVALPVLAAGCGGAKTPTTTVTRTVTVRAPAAPRPRPAMTQSTAQARLETLAFVAKRIYDEESRGTVDQSPIRQLERDPALVQAVGRGNAAAVQAEARRQLAAAAHITGIRIVRGKRTLANIALAFVIGAKARPLPGAGGSEIQISVQDVLGYVSLVHRVTGAEVVVRGSSGHVLSSLRAAGRTRLPGSGRLSLAGRRYALTSFWEPGWAGERLTVWLLEPV